VINMTGVCLHTNLGRAALPDAALVALLTAALGPTNLELDLETGRRGDRNALVADDLCALTGAEDALVVNNNAAGVLLALNTLAAGREVIVSRGELVEIGGSFRIPDVMAKSGARLREVGTTNRTHADDYRRATGPATAAVLRVHTSNYRIVGFTAAPTLAELVAVARGADVPLVEDLGGGALVDLAPYGIADEPVVRAHVAAGADLVLASGDKLLGGPQAGIIVGRRALVAALRSNPLFRALRPSKLVLAALAATLRLYRSAPDLPAALPVLGWLARPLADLERVGRAAAAVLGRRLGPDYAIEVVPSICEVGGGAAPGVELPTCALAVRHPSLGAERIAARLRRARPAVVGRVHEGVLLLDLRGIRDAAELAVELDAD
jgi:L-seryl-tRNA(Ser) seleniumtransferase